jgi:hypothetical protein
LQLALGNKNALVKWADFVLTVETSLLPFGESTDPFKVGASEIPKEECPTDCKVRMYTMA